MGGNSVKIFHEAVGEKNGCGIGFETEGKIMKEIVGQVLGARADFEDGDNFVDGQVATQTQVMDCLWGWVGSARLMGRLGARRTARSSSSWTTGIDKLLNKMAWRAAE